MAFKYHPEMIQRQLSFPEAEFERNIENISKLLLAIVDHPLPLLLEAVKEHSTVATEYQEDLLEDLLKKLYKVYRGLQVFGVPTVKTITNDFSIHHLEEILAEIIHNRKKDH